MNRPLLGQLFIPLFHTTLVRHLSDDQGNSIRPPNYSGISDNIRPVIGE